MRLPVATRHDGFRDFVLDQLAGLRGLTCRAMFGGFGLSYRSTFFGIIHKGRLYFKVTPETVASYIALGTKTFRASKTMTLKTYYEVPADILEDSAQLTEWAETANTAQRPQPARRRTSSKARRSTHVRTTRSRS
jgi:DNA transformation protein